MIMLSIVALKFDVAGGTDAGEANAVGYKDNYIDVYSNSWGPSDFGFIVNGPGFLLQRTLATGVTEVCIHGVYILDRALCLQLYSLFPYSGLCITVIE